VPMPYGPAATCVLCGADTHLRHVGVPYCLECVDKIDWSEIAEQLTAAQDAETSLRRK
jgi:hypothetical protein